MTLLITEILSPESIGDSADEITVGAEYFVESLLAAGYFREELPQEPFWLGAANQFCGAVHQHLPLGSDHFGKFEETPRLADARKGLEDIGYSAGLRFLDYCLGRGEPTPDDVADAQKNVTTAAFDILALDYLKQHPRVTFLPRREYDKQVSVLIEASPRDSPYVLSSIDHFLAYKTGQRLHRYKEGSGGRLIADKDDYRKICVDVILTRGLHRIYYYYDGSYAIFEFSTGRMLYRVPAKEFDKELPSGSNPPDSPVTDPETIKGIRLAFEKAKLSYEGLAQSIHFSRLPLGAHIGTRARAFGRETAIYFYNGHAEYIDLETGSMVARLGIKLKLFTEVLGTVDEPVDPQIPTG